MSKLQCNLLPYTKVCITFSLQNMNDKFDCSFFVFFFYYYSVNYYLLFNVKCSPF